MKYTLTDTSVVKLTETSGTIQNISSNSVEVSDSNAFSDTFVLYPQDICTFEGERYIRARDEVAQIIRVNVVPFFAKGGSNISNKVIAALENKILIAENGGQSFSFDDNLFATLKKYGILVKTSADS